MLVLYCNLLMKKVLDDIINLMIISIENDDLMKKLGQQIGSSLLGGEIIELVGDVGAGKTTFTKGLAIGMGIDEEVQSPSFTINRVYKNPNDLYLSHYDFYRLDNAGLMAEELMESISDDKTVIVIEWANSVSDFLPKDRLIINITSKSITDRELNIISGGDKSDVILGGIKW